VLLKAVVTDGSKARSKLIAEVLVTQFTKMVESLETTTAASAPTPTEEESPARVAARRTAVRVDVIAGPRLDPNPISPQPVGNLALAALLGLLVGIGAALLLDATHRSAERIEAPRD
jgi:capsular polysaccharide biosynthesis protein